MNSSLPAKIFNLIPKGLALFLVLMPPANPAGVTSVKLVEIRDCGSRRPDAVAPVEGCLPSVRLRAAIDGMADCAAGAAPLSSPAPDGAPLRGCGA